MGGFAQVHAEPDTFHATSDEKLLESSLHGINGQRVAFEGEVLCGNEEEDGSQVVQPTISEGIKMRFQRLGMLSEALDGWAQYHVNLCVAMAYFFGGQLVLLATAVYLLTGAAFTRLYYSVPYCIGIVMHLGHIALAWRLGPNLTARPIIQRPYPGPLPQKRKVVRIRTVYILGSHNLRALGIYG